MVLNVNRNFVSTPQRFDWNWWSHNSYDYRKFQPRNGSIGIACRHVRLPVQLPFQPRNGSIGIDAGTGKLFPESEVSTPQRFDWNGTNALNVPLEIVSTPQRFDWNYVASDQGAIDIEFQPRNGSIGIYNPAATDRAPGSFNPATVRLESVEGNREEARPVFQPRNGSIGITSSVTIYRWETGFQPRNGSIGICGRVRRFQPRRVSTPQRFDWNQE